MSTKGKNPHAVALAKKGARKGGLARAANMTPQERSENARKAIRARWDKLKNGVDSMSLTTSTKKLVSAKTPTQFGEQTHEVAPRAPALDMSRKDLHQCLDRLKIAKDEKEIRRLTRQLQRIVFHKQYENAEN